MKPTYKELYIERDALFLRLKAANKKLAELRQALTGRTMSCAWCNDTAKNLDSLKSKHQDLQNAVDSIIKLELEFVSCRAKEEWMADWAVAFSNLVKVSGKNNDDTN